MEAGTITAPSATSGASTSSNSGSEPQTTPKPAPSEPTKTSYMVFEAPGEKLKVGDALTFVASVEAPDKTLARWAAVDKVGGDLAKRASEEKGGEGVYLLAIAERNGRPEMTFEEVVKTTVRK